MAKARIRLPGKKNKLPEAPISNAPREESLLPPDDIQLHGLITAMDKVWNIGLNYATNVSYDPNTSLAEPFGGFETTYFPAQNCVYLKSLGAGPTQIIGLSKNGEGCSEIASAIIKEGDTVAKMVVFVCDPNKSGREDIVPCNALKVPTEEAQSSTPTHAITALECNNLSAGMNILLSRAVLTYPDTFKQAAGATALSQSIDRSSAA